MLPSDFPATGLSSSALSGFKFTENGFDYSLRSDDHAQTTYEVLQKRSCEKVQKWYNENKIKALESGFRKLP